MVSSFVLILLLLSVSVPGSLAYFIWSYRQTPGAKEFAFAMFLAALWALDYMLYLTTPGLEAKIFWNDVRFIIVSVMPLSWLALTLQFTGLDAWLTRKRIAGLLAVPGLTVLFSLTSPFHHIFRYGFFLEKSGPFSLLGYSNGVWFWVHVGYSYVISMACLVILVRSLFNTAELFRSQAVLVLTGVLVPTITDLLFQFRITPIAGFNFTTVLFPLTGLLVAWGLFRYRMLEVAPFGSQAILDNIHDLIFVLDKSERVVDYNAAARRSLFQTNGKPSAVTGETVEKVFSAWPELMNQLHSPERTQATISLQTGSGTRQYDLLVTPILDVKKQFDGKLAVCRDITDHVQAERELASSEARYRELLENAPFPILVSHLDNHQILFANHRAAQIFDILEEEPEQLSVGDFFLNMDDYRCAVADLVAQGNLSNVVVKLKTFHGRTFFASLSANLIDFHGYKAVFMAVLDITEQKQIEEAERELRLMAEALRDTAAAFTRTLDFDEVLDAILTNVGKVVPHNLVNIMLIDDDGCAYVVRYGGYIEAGMESLITNIRLPVEETYYLKQMQQTGLPVIVGDVFADPKWVLVENEKWLRSYISAPIRVKGETMGFINLDSETPYFFNQTQAERLQAIADQAAVAIQNARLFAKLENAAITDPLTGLNNRRYFFTMAEIEVERAVRYHHPLAAMMVDIDDFKKVNDQHGHIVGDYVLQTIGQTLRNSLRRVDVIGRYGGEEFVVILPETGPEEALSAAERLRKDLVEAVYVSHANTFRVTASLGLAALDERSDTLESLLDRADQALYVAKRQGKNRVIQK